MLTVISQIVNAVNELATAQPSGGLDLQDPYVFALDLAAF
jgi:hypothetical protein